MHFYRFYHRKHRKGKIAGMDIHAGHSTITKNMLAKEIMSAVQHRVTIRNAAFENSGDAVLHPSVHAKIKTVNLLYPRYWHFFSISAFWLVLEPTYEFISKKSTFSQFSLSSFAMQCSKCKWVEHSFFVRQKEHNSS